MSKTPNDLTNNELYKLLLKANKDQMEELKTEINSNLQQLSTKLNVVESKAENLQNKVSSPERKSRHNNVIMFGLKVDQNNLLYNTLDFLNNILGITIQKMV